MNPREINGRAEGNYFRFLFAYADRILHPGLEVVNPSPTLRQIFVEETSTPHFHRLRTTFSSLL